MSVVRLFEYAAHRGLVQLAQDEEVDWVEDPPVS